jgi:Cu(I)/Ag(I) efflux system membrane fusion protein
MSHRLAVRLVSAVLLAGCGGPEPASQPPSPAADAPPSAQQHTGFGTVNSVDRAAGKVNISHAAVASAGWPAMTMDFTVADPKLAEQLEAGERIEFRFTTENGGTLTAVEPLR